MAAWEGIPTDEHHRFLRWLPDEADLAEWARWFRSRGVRFAVVNDERRGWSIYKHNWVEEAGKFCCGADR